LEDFGDSEYSEEEFSSESEGSLVYTSPPVSSDDSDDSQGIAAEVWTYIRAVERSGIKGSDESEISSHEENSSDSSEEESDGDDDGDDGDDGDDDGKGDGGSSGKGDDGKGDGDGGKGE
jgi:pilus assembly protein FimV